MVNSRAQVSFAVDGNPVRLRGEGPLRAAIGRGDLHSGTSVVVEIDEEEVYAGPAGGYLGLTPLIPTTSERQIEPEPEAGEMDGPTDPGDLVETVQDSLPVISEAGTNSESTTVTLTEESPSQADEAEGSEEARREGDSEQALLVQEEAEPFVLSPGHEFGVARRPRQGRLPRGGQIAIVVVLAVIALLVTRCVVDRKPQAKVSGADPTTGTLKPANEVDPKVKDVSVTVAAPAVPDRPERPLKDPAPTRPAAVDSTNAGGSNGRDADSPVSPPLYSPPPIPQPRTPKTSPGEADGQPLRRPPSPPSTPGYGSPDRVSRREIGRAARRPTESRILAVAPRAIRPFDGSNGRGWGGAVSVSCLVGNDNWLVDCEIVQAHPRGDLGDLWALSIAREYRLQPIDDRGRTTAGRRIEFTIGIPDIR